MSTIERSSAQWYQDDWPTKARWHTVLKFLIHDTEGTDWPAYADDMGRKGAKAPNATLKWDAARSVLKVRPHFDPNVSARALRNESGGLETNAVPGGVHQVEVVGTCSRETSKQWQRRGLKPGVDYIEMWDPPEAFMDALAAYWLDLHERFGTPLKLGSTRWTRYPSSPALDRATRLTGNAWVKAGGLVGHLHADENEHLDPGDFPAADLLRRALALKAGHPTTQEDDVTPDDIERVADRVVAKLLTTNLRLGTGNQAAAGRLQDGKRTLTVNDALASAGLRSFEAAAGTTAVAGAIKAIGNTGGGLPPDALRAIAEAGARVALGDLVSALQDSATDGQAPHQGG